MGLFSFWKKRKRKNIPQEATDEEVLPKIMSRDTLDVKNAKQREEYVRNCCEQMLEAGQSRIPGCDRLFDGYGRNRSSSQRADGRVGGER